MRLRHAVIPVLALAGIAVMIFTVYSGQKELPPAPPVARPATPPFSDFIAGAGLVEASTQNIGVGADLAGVVATVLVKVGDQVRAGQPLFVLDDRQARAEVAVQEGHLRVAEVNVAKLKALPRKEEIPTATARLAEAKALAVDAQQQLSRAERSAVALTPEELDRRRHAAAAAAARLAEAQAALDLLTAGAWKPDLAIAEAQVTAAKAQLNAVLTQLERHTVRAPVAGEILQVNIRSGEYLSAATMGTPPILMGDTQVLHVRIDIDENDAWRFSPGTPAVASLRGNAEVKTPVRFVRVEPYVVPKRSLTGGSSERVDTRVLQVLYAFDHAELPIFVGQQMDVFIEAAPYPVVQAPPR